MALGILLIFMISLFVVTLICVALLWIAKRERFNQVMVWLCFLISWYIVYLSVSSLPTNYMISKMIAWLIGGVSLIGMGCFFKKKLLLTKVFITLSIILGIIQLFFF